MKKTCFTSQEYSTDDIICAAFKPTLRSKNKSEKFHYKTQHTKKINCRKINRALILQGGGALGSYEVGVLKSLSESLQNEDKMRGDVERPLFDIVAGSSMGAVNAAILVHNVTFPKERNQTIPKIWDAAIERLYDFYMEISDPVISHPLWWINKLLENKMFEQSWNISNLLKKLFFALDFTACESFISQKHALLEKNRIEADENILFPLLQYTDFLKQAKYNPVPTAENARRYYSYLSSILFGIPKVLSPAIVQPDLSYYDPLWLTHIYTRFSNEPLIKTMKNFWDYDKFPIKTRHDQPRLLLVTVDVEDSSVPVIIDSHSKNEGKNSLYTEYGNLMQYRLNYQDGITADHIRASMSTPLRHEYPSFEVYNKKTRQHESRHFWDGAFISNSPVLEVIDAHTDYWQNHESCEPPDLELYIINLFSAVKKGIPNDSYSIQDRETDMKFQNRIVPDMINDINFRSRSEKIVEHLINYSRKNNIEMSSILPDDFTKSDLFDLLNDNKRHTPLIAKVVTIERQEDVANSVFGKVFDFSRKTILKLIDDGYHDARKTIMK
jgi:NTE family protein